MLSLSLPSRVWRFLIILATIFGAIALFPTSKDARAQTGEDTGAITVRSDVQEANSETGVITARGNVQIYFPARQIQATATQAQYFSRERRLVLSGDVYVLQEGNSMRAETMTYLVDEGRFVASPKPKQQVESTYIITEPNASGNTQAEPQINIEPNSSAPEREPLF